MRGRLCWRRPGNCAEVDTANGAEAKAVANASVRGLRVELKVLFVDVSPKYIFTFYASNKSMPCFTQI